jgi:hypothetical protein
MNKILILVFIIVYMTACGQKETEKAETAGQIPVLAWYSIPHDQTSLKRYLELKEAGITHNLSFFPQLWRALRWWHIALSLKQKLKKQ